MESTPATRDKSNDETEETEPRNRLITIGNYLTSEIKKDNVKSGIISAPLKGNSVSVPSTSENLQEELSANRILHVPELPKQVDAYEVYELLQSFGPIEDVNIKIDSFPPNGHSVYIVFKYPEDANSVLELGEQLLLRGNTLEFSLALHPELDDLPPQLFESPFSQYCSQYRFTQLLEIRQMEGGRKEILDGGDQNSFIGKLDKKCLVKIFSYIDINELNSIARVCKRWPALVQEAWKNVVKLDGNVNPKLFSSSFMLEQVLKRCDGSVKEICVGSENVVTASFYSVIAKNARQLETLTIENNAMKAESLRVIGDNCAGLKKLTIRKCFGLTDEGLRSIFETNLNIETLVLEDEKIRGRSLMTGLCKLKSLSLIKCKLLRPKYVLKVLENTTVGMEKLELIECFKFLERHIVRTLLRAPDVKILIIDGSYFGSDVLMYPVFHMTFLRKISLSFSNAITPELVHSLKENCLQLTDINLDGLGQRNSRTVNPTVFTILGQITQLEHLSISYSPMINSTSLDAVLPNLTNLKTVKFVGCSKMDAISVPRLLISCPNLTFIDVSGSIRSRKVLFSRVRVKKEELLERKTKTDVWIGEFNDIYVIEEDEKPNIPDIQFVEKSSYDEKMVDSSFDHYLWDKFEDSDDESTEDIPPEDGIMFITRAVLGPNPLDLIDYE